MMLQVLEWWIISTLLGAAAYPLIWRILHRLRDRGYAFARIGGILGASYIFWIGASFSVLPNSLGGSLAAVAIFAVLSGWSLRGQWAQLWDWLKENRKTILSVELLFLFSFAAWAFVRASNPDINGTEKPMELAFLNAILRSDRFPPQDPWLSGYAISYYYFGYIQLALLTRLTGVAAGVAFNLGNALWFALCILGTYGLVFNLINHERERLKFSGPLLGPLFVVITGNLQAFFEMLHTRRLFWSGLESGQPVSAFWSWLGVKDLVAPPVTEVSLIPNRYYWWWRASRVVNDLNLSGGEVEVIDEFPFFSFLLADNHPHLLALPFALLALAFTLQLYYAGKRAPQRLGAFRWTRRAFSRVILGTGFLLLILFASNLFQASRAGAGFLEATGAGVAAALKTGLLLGALGLFFTILLGGVKTVLQREELWIAGLIFGGLTFLNAWDLPLYGSVFILVIWWSQREETLQTQLREVGLAGAGMLIGAILLYYPWYPSFASQAGGILPNIIFPTRVPQFIVMFATALIPIGIWLSREAWSGLRRRDLKGLAGIAIGIPFFLWLFSLALTALLAVYSHRYDPVSYEIAMSGIGAESTRDVLRAAVERRLEAAGTVLVLGAIAAAAILLLWKRFRISSGTRLERQGGEENPTNAFILILLIIGTLLILGPEYVYLKDQFGTRMNTIFKFYFAAWTLWGIAAAYGTHVLLQLPGRKRLLAAIALVPLGMGLLYPLFGVWTKTNGFNPQAGRTIDGTAYLWLQNPGDAEAIEWINATLANGVVAEAVGGSYSSYARISEHTGLQAVIGWPGHESQWRGSASLLGSREEDVRTLYQTRNWNEAVEILDRYGIDYIYVGYLERNTYQPLIEAKFEASMQLIYEQGDVRIYGRIDEVNP